MNGHKQSTKRLVIIAMFCAIIVVMQLTGIGLIPLPGIKLTTMHIPVILGAILLGPKAGAIFGGVFGICSMWANTTTPGVTAFVFSPFMSQDGLTGAIKAIWVALGCRILLGVFAGWAWILLRKIKIHKAIALPITAIISTLFHTVIVLSSMYLLFANSLNVAYDTIITLIMAAITGNGIFEITAAVVIVTVLGLTVIRFFDNDKAEGGS